MQQRSRVALVTGASRGLGARIARRLALDGLAVAVNYHQNAAKAESLVLSIREAGGQAAAFQGNVTDRPQVADLVGRIESALGSIDVLVLNATGPQPKIPVEDVDWDALLAQLDYFVKSPVLLLGRVLPGMEARRFGRVIHIGSDITELLPAGSTAYAVAKTAQLGLARSWAKELAPRGVTVNTVAPGWVPVERHAMTPREVLDAYAARVPARRLGTPEDVAGAVSFLASDAAAFVTGARLTVNGGMTLD
jgi:3-oxoacyl-[acyl-carrier protein] reductase